MSLFFRGIQSALRRPVLPRLPRIANATSKALSRGLGGLALTAVRRFHTAAPAARISYRKALLIAGAALVPAAVIGHTVYNCGIVAYIGKDPAVQYLLEGLSILQNRGYDSAGIATIKNKEVVVTKFASVGSTSDSIALLAAKAPAAHAGDTVGIAHTRWATHGGKTDENAHPHTDMKNRVALVHNGTIENANKLRDELVAQGIKFTSQTDTEVIAQLIGTYLDQNLPIMEAVKKALARLEGTWGLAIICKSAPDQIIAARHGSPLVVGISEGKMFVASEITAFCRHTNSYIALNDGEVAVVKADGVNLDLARMEKAVSEKMELTPDPYKHWTIKEIMEQPEAISRALNFGGRLSFDGVVRLGGLEANKHLLLDIKHLTIAACGTSLYAGMYGGALMRHLGSFDTVSAVDAAELTPEYFPPNNAGMVVLSQSGETKDVHRAVQVAEDLNVPRFSVVNAVGSLIARSTKCGVYVNAGREHAVASTKAFTSQVTVMALIAAWFAQSRQALEASKAAAATAAANATPGAPAAPGQVVVAPQPPKIHDPHYIPDVPVSQRRQRLLESLHRLPTYSGMTLKCHEDVKKIAKKLKNKEHMFILGRGFADAVAREGALKVKEITYIHAEGFHGGALKHGPFALIEKGTPVVLMILDDKEAQFMRTAAHEVRARGAHTVVISDNPKLCTGIADDLIVIPSNGPLTALLAVLPLQLLAYEITQEKGFDPDKPRNLAKAVTVD